VTAPLVAILAGGEGRRIGGGKPLRRLAGERLIDRAAQLARLWSHDVRLSLRSGGQVSGIDLPVLIDDQAIDGPLAGLRAALAAAQAEGLPAVLTIPCDTPFLPRDLAARLEAAGAPVALAASSSGPHPACAWWRTEIAAPLDAYLASGGRSLIGLARAVGHAEVRWPDACFLNINSAADLAEAERRLASEIQGFDRGAGRERLDPGA
jgi:molybdenum cofactor guanylyltransferase